MKEKVRAKYFRGVGIFHSPGELIDALNCLQTRARARSDAPSISRRRSHDFVSTVCCAVCCAPSSCTNLSDRKNEKMCVTTSCGRASMVVVVALDKVVLVLAVALLLFRVVFEEEWVDNGRTK